jgi:hypothetical protein
LFCRIPVGHLIEKCFFDLGQQKCACFLHRTDRHLSSSRSTISDTAAFVYLDLRPLAAGSSQRGPGFVSTTFNVRFVLNKVTLGWFSSECLFFPPVSIIPPQFHTHSYITWGLDKLPRSRRIFIKTVLHILAAVVVVVVVVVVAIIIINLTSLIKQKFIQEKYIISAFRYLCYAVPHNHYTLLPENVSLSFVHSKRSFFFRSSIPPPPPFLHPMPYSTHTFLTVTVQYYNVSLRSLYTNKPETVS